MTIIELRELKIYSKKMEVCKMKYCEKCGAQMEDEAVLCVACGCMVREVMIKSGLSKDVRSKNRREDGERLPVVLSFSLAHTVFSTLAFFFVLLSMLYANYEVISRTTEGVVRKFTMLPEEPFVIVALAMSIFSLLCGLASFIAALAVGTKNKEWVFAFVGKLVASVLLLLICAVSLRFNINIIRF